MCGVVVANPNVLQTYEGMVLCASGSCHRYWGWQVCPHSSARCLRRSGSPTRAITCALSKPWWKESWRRSKGRCGRLNLGATTEQVKRISHKYYPPLSNQATSVVLTPSIDYELSQIKSYWFIPPDAWREACVLLLQSSWGKSPRSGKNIVRPNLAARSNWLGRGVADNSCGYLSRPRKKGQK